MTFEEGLVAKLKAAAGVTAITSIIVPVKGRAGADKAKDALPTQVIFSLVGRGDLDQVDEDTGYRLASFSLLCVSEDYITCVALADAVENALHFQHSGYGTVDVKSATVRSVEDGFIDGELGVYARAINVEFGYQR